jgi:hypothetical protein
MSSEDELILMIDILGGIAIIFVLLSPLLNNDKKGKYKQ